MENLDNLLHSYALNHHAIHGYTQYFGWAMFNSYVGKLPEGKFQRPQPATKTHR